MRESVQTDAAPSRSITSDRVGFVGTGIMGGPMAMRLLDAGFALTVCDPNPAAIFSGTFKHSGPLFKGLKDAELFLEEAERLGAPVWVARSVVEMYREAAANGYKDLDSMRLIEYMEDLAGVSTEKRLGPSSRKPEE